jgi:hypothetical protein
MPRRLSFASKLVFDTDAEKPLFFTLLAIYGNWERLEINEISNDDQKSILTPFKFAVAGYPTSWFRLKGLSICGNKMSVSLFTGRGEPSLYAPHSTLDYLCVGNCRYPMPHLQKVLAWNTSQNVQELHLHNLTDLLPAGEVPFIHNANIRVLSVEGAEALWALCYMTFPSLKSLKMIGINEDVIPTIMGFLERCSENLEFLELHDLDWQAPNIFSIFTCLSAGFCELILDNGNLLRFVDIWAVLLALPGLGGIVLLDKPEDGACHDFFELVPWHKICWALQQRREKKPNAPCLVIAHHGLALYNGRFAEILQSLVAKDLIAFVEASPFLPPPRCNLEC